MCTRGNGDAAKHNGGLEQTQQSCGMWSIAQQRDHQSTSTWELLDSRSQRDLHPCIPVLLYISTLRVDLGLPSR